jgi:hypothetical protein
MPGDIVDRPEHPLPAWITASYHVSRRVGHGGPDPRVTPASETSSTERATFERGSLLWLYRAGARNEH